MPDDTGGQMVRSGPGSALPDALTRLREALQGLAWPLQLPGADAQRERATRTGHQLDDYLLPRLASLDAPLLCVVGGSTGAGKSTLVNSLVGRRVTAPGVTRPTTRAPVLVHHPDDADWFTGDRILPGLARTSTEVGVADTEGTRALQLVAEPTLPRGLALLDAPDVDSVDRGNRELAAQLLAAADLWLFVTSAARYADAVPWDYLTAAAARSAAIGVVLDRVSHADLQPIGTHLGQLMAAAGLGDAPLFAVPETAPDRAGLLPGAAVDPIKGWLAGIAHDQASRTAVVQRTLDGAIAQLVADLPAVADSLDAQVAALDTLRSDVDRSYAEAVRTVGVQTADGTLLRGEVLTRWHEFVGTGEFFRALERKVGWLRDKVVAALSGRPASATKVQVAVEAGLEALIREEGDAAAERAEAAWRAHPAGRALLDAAAGDRTIGDLARSSHAYGAAVATAIRDWQADVLALVADEGMTKRSRARFLALGVNVLGVALMIVVFSQTGGLLGAEVGVAGGTAVLAQRVLEAVFGDQAIRTLAERAKEELDGRVESLLAGELQRYHRVLDGLDLATDRAARLRAAVAEIAAVQGIPVDLADPARTRPGDPAALPPVRRPDGPHQLPAGSGPVVDAEDAEIVDAEIVEAGTGEAGAVDAGIGDRAPGARGPEES